MENYLSFQKKFQKCCVEILEELANPEYHCPKEMQNNIKSRLSRCTIQLTEKQGNEFKSTLPQILPDTIEQPSFTLQIQMFENPAVFSSVCYHEICHLFSEGDWKLIPHHEQIIAKHISGINREFCYLKGDTYHFLSDDFSTLDELINDWVASKLYEKVQNTQYIGNGLYQLPEFISFIDNVITFGVNCNYPKLIGLYFSNKATDIQTIFQKIDKNYNLKNLNQYFAKILKKRNDWER